MPQRPSGPSVVTTDTAVAAIPSLKQKPLAIRAALPLPPLTGIFPLDKEKEK
jgi:hypothetical protein